MSATLNLHRCSVRRNSNILTVTRVGECRIDLLAFFGDPSATDEENGLIDRLTDGLPEAIAEAVDLSTDELVMLAAIRDRQQPAPTPAAPPAPAPVAPPAPAAPTAPVGAVNLAHTHAALTSRQFGTGETMEERRITQLQNVISVYDEDMHQIEYDIPDHVSKAENRANRVDNPSDWFWRFAVRRSLSCWIFPERTYRLPAVQEYLNRAERLGCTITHIRYHPDDVAQVRKWAEKALREELVRLHTALVTNIASADATLASKRAEIDASLQPIVGPMLQAAELATDPMAAQAARENAQKARDSRVRSIIGAACESLENAIKGAELFDQTDTLADLIRAYRESIKATSLAFNQHARQRGIKPAPLPS